MIYNFNQLTNRVLKLQNFGFLDSLKGNNLMGGLSKDDFIRRIFMTIQDIIDRVDLSEFINLDDPAVYLGKNGKPFHDIKDSEDSDNLHRDYLSSVEVVLGTVYAVEEFVKSKYDPKNLTIKTPFSEIDGKDVENKISNIISDNYKVSSVHLTNNFEDGNDISQMDINSGKTKPSDIFYFFKIQLCLFKSFAA